MIVSTKELDIRKTYHVRFSIYTNIFAINKEAYTRMINSGISASIVHFLKFQTSGYNYGAEKLSNHIYTPPIGTLDDYWQGKYPLSIIRDWRAFYVQTFFKTASDIKYLNPEVNRVLDDLK